MWRQASGCSLSGLVAGAFAAVSHGCAALGIGAEAAGICAKNICAIGGYDLGLSVLPTPHYEVVWSYLQG